MSRLILALCALGLLSACGCGKKSTEASNAGDSGSGGALATRQALAKEPVPIAETYVKDSLTGQEVEITLTKDVGVIFKKNPATAVHVRFKIKGEQGEKNWILLVQDGKTRNQIDYDSNKSLEENAKALVAATE